MSILGIGAGFLAKFFQIIEYTACLKLLNSRYDELSDIVMSLARSLADLDLIDFFTEPKMKNELSNSIAGPWREKLSAEGIAPWILQDIGYTGVLMLALYAIQLFLLLSGLNNKVSQKISSIRLKLSSILIFDIFSMSQRTLNQGSLSSMSQPLQKLSFLVSWFLLTCLTTELAWQYIRQEKLGKIPSNKLSASEKKEWDVYFDSLEESEIRNSFYVRHSNLIFTAKLLITQILIYTLQNLKTFQICFQLVFSIVMLAISLGQNFKFKIHQSRFIKIFRLIQECSYSIILAIVWILYQDESSGGFSKEVRFRFEVSFCLLIGVNILMEFVILLKEITGVFIRCKKKTTSKIHPQEGKIPPDKSTCVQKEASISLEKLQNNSDEPPEKQQKGDLCDVSDLNSFKFDQNSFEIGSGEGSELISHQKK